MSATGEPKVFLSPFCVGLRVGGTFLSPLVARYPSPGQVFLHVFTGKGPFRVPIDLLDGERTRGVERSGDT